MSDRAQRINDILYRHDPMHTCCNVNEGMEDEYRQVAEELAGIPSAALHFMDLRAVLAHWFDDVAGAGSHDALLPVFAAIQTLDSRHG